MQASLVFIDGKAVLVALAYWVENEVEVVVLMGKDFPPT